METLTPKQRATALHRFHKGYLESYGGCWRWIRARDTGGYGRIRVGNGYMGAHRFSWEIHRGPIPEGMLVCHKCDVPCCVNPEHLFIGTTFDNSVDKMRKGRYASADNNPGLRDTWAEVPMPTTQRTTDKA